MRLIAKGLKISHKIWSRILPSYYHAYRLPNEIVAIKNRINVGTN